MENRESEEIPQEVIPRNSINGVVSVRRVEGIDVQVTGDRVKIFMSEFSLFINKDVWEILAEKVESQAWVRHAEESSQETPPTRGDARTTPSTEERESGSEES